MASTSRSKRSTKRKQSVDEEFLTETVPSNVFDSSIDLEFEPSIWIRESLLTKIERKTLDRYYPHGVSEHGELTLVGKARSKLSKSNRITDQLGQAKKSKLKLEICYANKIFELDTFIVLNFSKSNCFKWVPVSIDNENISMPKYALRLGFDTVSQNCLFVGRALIGKQNYNLIGHLTSYNRLLQTPFKEVQICKNYEILCLKPTPASLKQLCRNNIRQLMGFENTNIMKLEYYLESSLIKYVKFSSSLKCDWSLKRSEFLESKNGKYKFGLLPNGDLVYCMNENRDYLFLYENVESLWFNDLRLVVCFDNFATSSFLTDFSNLNIIYKDAKLKLRNDGNLHLISPSHSSKIVIQFRDDILTYWNSKKPKFDFVYFFEQNKNYNKDSSGEDEENEDDDENTSSSNSSSDSSCESDN